MAEISYQTVNFHFKVDFNFDAEDKTDIRFQSVTGLDSTLDTETIKEGGENRFEHVLPVRRKYGPLTLKRGLIKPDDSSLTKWLKRAFDDESVEPIQSVNIALLDEQHNTLMHWTINNVWPRSWKIGELNAEQGAVLIETLELNYNRLLFDNPS
ncbi:MAG TPA: phage tail protein [Parafilimonas sp.]|jgi:phage tail-like protein|nr:phage tail protein [Parafilimonas sp.]